MWLICHQSTVNDAGKITQERVIIITVNVFRLANKLISNSLIEPCLSSYWKQCAIAQKNEFIYSIFKDLNSEGVTILIV